MQMPKKWECKCGVTNVLRPLDPWPNVPREIYVGQDKSQLLKLYPVSPDHADAPWAQPFSVRSVVAQASRRFGGCAYRCSKRGEVMGEPVFDDHCHDPLDEYGDSSANCHMLAGWSIGQDSCALWEDLAKLCQTDSERKFLHWYLGLVRDRQFPMLIPQTRIGIAERRRPDFVLFVPLQYWKYKWYAIELDKAHPKGVVEFADGVRNADVAKHGYEVVSLKPEGQGYLQEVKTLVEKIERDLSEVENDPWAVAIQAEVRSTYKSEDVPF